MILKHQSNSFRLPYSAIQAAVGGDTTAINRMLEYYEGYISKLSTKRYYDQWGNIYECVDEDMRRQLQAKLIMKISSFKLY